MNITSSHKGQTTKTATVAGVTAETVEDAVDMVMAHFGENEDRIFGIFTTHNDDGMVTVQLWTE